MQKVEIERDEKHYYVFVESFRVKVSPERARKAIIKMRDSYEDPSEMIYFSDDFVVRRDCIKSILGLKEEIVDYINTYE